MSLSPAQLQQVEGVERLVLPSPNGSTISQLLADSGATVVAGSLRNASAVAHWLAPRVSAGASVAFVAAGERWPDGSLRPAVEDLWGCGAILGALLDQAPASVPISAEGRAAAAAWAVVSADLGQELSACASGRELVEAGFAEDVRVTGQSDVSSVVPVLIDGAFTAGGWST